MELKPFPLVLLHLRGVLLCLQHQQVVLSHLALALSFVLRLGGTFRLLQIHESKVSLLLFKLLLDLDVISVGRAERGNVQEFYYVLDVPV